MNCTICKRKAVSDLCQYHQAAKEKLEEAYPIWDKAYGGIGWKEYLDNVKRNAQTGQWAKDIASLLEES